MGTVHADNSLPDRLVVDRLAGQGLLLIMTWLAVKLGVDEAVLAEVLNH